MNDASTAYQLHRRVRSIAERFAKQLGLLRKDDAAFCLGVARILKKHLGDALKNLAGEPVFKISLDILAKKAGRRILSWIASAVLEYYLFDRPKELCDLVFRMSFQVMGSTNDASDAAQEAVMRLLKVIWTRIPDRPKHLRDWVYRLVTNVCLDAIRRENRQQPKWQLDNQNPAKDAAASNGNHPCRRVDEQNLPDHHSETKVTELKDSALKLRMMLRSIDPMGTDMLILRLSGYTPQEIADKYNEAGLFNERGERFTMEAVNKRIRRLRKEAARRMSGKAE